MSDPKKPQPGESQPGGDSNPRRPANGSGAGSDFERPVFAEPRSPRHRPSDGSMSDSRDARRGAADADSGAADAQSLSSSKSASADAGRDADSADRTKAGGSTSTEPSAYQPPVRYPQFEPTTTTWPGSAAHEQAQRRAQGHSDEPSAAQEQPLGQVGSAGAGAGAGADSGAGRAEGTADGRESSVWGARSTATPAQSADQWPATGQLPTAPDRHADAGASHGSAGHGQSSPQPQTPQEPAGYPAAGAGYSAPSGTDVPASYQTAGADAAAAVPGSNQYGPGQYGSNQYGPNQYAPVQHGPVQHGGPQYPVAAGAPQTAVVDRKNPQRAGWFRRGFGVGMGFSIATVLVWALVSIPLALLTVGVIAAMAESGDSANQGREVVWGPAAASKSLIAIPVEGVIMGSGGGDMPFGTATYGYNIAKKIDSINAKDADGLILEMNTPGGTIFGSRAIADAVERYQKRTDRKVFAYVRGMSASGGMYAMSGADFVAADHGTAVGSIGVIFGPVATYTDVKATDGGILGGGVTTTGGIKQEYFTAGKGKDFGNPYRPMTEEERNHYKSFIMNDYNDFVEFVAKKRDISAQKVRDDIGAFLYDPQTAVQRKLIDAEMNRDDAYRKAADINGVKPDEFKVVRDRQPTLLETLLTAKVFGAQAKSREPLSTYREFTPGVTVNVAGCGAQASAWAYHGDLTAVCGR